MKLKTSNYRQPTIKHLMKQSCNKSQLNYNAYRKLVNPVTIEEKDERKYIRPVPRKNTTRKREIDRIEALHRQQSRKNRIRVVDYSTSLPEALYKRVAKIIPLPRFEMDVFEPNIDAFEENSEFTVQTPFTQKEEHQGTEFHSEKKFNESTCSLIEKMQQKFTNIDLRMEQPADVIENKRNVNWFSEYMCEEKRQRIKWKSKLYKLEEDTSQKQVEEQADEMMEAVAERFANWINSYGTSDTHITKEYIRNLFNIDNGAKLLSGVKIDPRIIKSVPHHVAKTWGMPQMSMTNKFENKLAERKAKMSNVVIKHAFGRTIPSAERPWQPSNADKTIEPYCPEELLTQATIFDGIVHLKSTRKLIEHLEKNPDLERPPYLVQNGLFKMKTMGEKCKPDDVPLYEQIEMAQEK